MQDSDSETSRAFKKKGDEYLKEGDYQKAIQYYQKAIKLNPDYIQAWHNLGHSFLKIGQKEDAIKCNKKKKELETFREVQNIPNHVSKKIDPPFPQKGVDTKIRKSDEEINPLLKESGIVDGNNFFPAGQEPVSTIGRINSFWPSKRREENPQNNPISDNFDGIRKIILISVIIGVSLCIILLVVGSGSERYTQFYLLPDSIYNANDPFINTGSFTYGVKSFENENVQYNLFVYAGSELKENKTFNLFPGEIREEQIIFNYPTPMQDDSVKISVKLQSPYAVYNLHYWIKR